jgi:hypothetical protein
VRNYATIAGPLTDLLKRHNFHWTDGAQAAFQALKAAMISLPVLGVPDFSTPFDVTTDASGIAIGAVLSQHTHPIAFFSQKLCQRMSLASAYEREMYAITSAVKKWRHYLLGRRFRIYTDQKSLRGLLSQTIQTPAQHKWLTKLLGFDYEIFYTPGRENVVADALSRMDTASELLFSAISVCEPEFLEQLRKFYLTDPIGQALITKFQGQTNMQSPFAVHQGLLYYHTRLFIPLETTLREQLLTEFHSTPLGGHSGVRGTIARLAASFAWPHMAKDVQQFVQQCSVCQQHKYPTHKPYGLLQPLPIPQQVWEDISMDFITHLPSSHGKSTIWVVVDRLSKYAHFIPLPPHYTAVSLASLFISEIYRLHGMPKTIVSDRDRIFISRFWKELFKLNGTTLCFSSAYHPQTDGQTEVTNRILETFLRCFVCDSPKAWVTFLPLAEYWYNSSYQSAIKMTPFEALYGRSPPQLRSYCPGTTAVAALDDTLTQHHQILKVVKDNLQRAQMRMRSQANSHRQEREFAEGSWVWLRLQPYRQSTIRNQPYSKFTKRYFGPYQILRRIGKVAYELQLPPDGRIHPVFHISKLKAFYGTPPTQIPLLDPSVTGTLVPLIPAKVLGSRSLLRAQQSVDQVLIQWQGLSELEATWEDVSIMQTKYPDFNLEDKVTLDGVSNDTGVQDTIGPRAEVDNLRPKSTRARREPAWKKDFVSK